MPELMPHVFPDAEFIEWAEDPHRHPAFAGLVDPAALWREEERLSRQINDLVTESFATNTQNGNRTAYDWRLTPVERRDPFTVDLLTDARARDLHREATALHERKRLAIVAWQEATRQAAGDIATRLRATRSRYTELLTRGICPGDPEWTWLLAYRTLKAFVGMI